MNRFTILIYTTMWNIQLNRHFNCGQFHWMIYMKQPHRPSKANPDNIVSPVNWMKRVPDDWFENNHLPKSLYTSCTDIVSEQFAYQRHRAVLDNLSLTNNILTIANIRNTNQYFRLKYSQVLQSRRTRWTNIFEIKFLKFLRIALNETNL